MNRGIINTKLSTVVTWCICILLVLDYDVFGLLELPYPLSLFLSVYNRLMPGVLALALGIFIVKIFPQVINTNSFCFYYLVLVIVSFLFIDLHSFLIYRSSESLSGIFRTNSHYLYLFMIPAVLWILLIQGGYRELLDNINVINFIWYLVVILQQFVYLLMGKTFLAFTDMLRDGRLRINLLSFGNFMIIYNFDYVWNKRGDKRKSHWLQLGMGLYCMIFIQQTRAFMLAVILSIAGIIIVSSDTLKKTATSVLLTVTTLIFLIYSGILEKFTSALLQFDSGTVGVRVRAIQYYWSAFLNSPVFGQGVIMDAANSSIARGADGIFYYSDVGIFGSLAQFGLFTVFLYVVPLVFSIEIACKILLNKYCRKKFGLIIGMVIFMVVSTPTLIFTDQERIFLFPVYLAILEYVNMLMKGQVIVINKTGVGENAG